MVRLVDGGGKYGLGGRKEVGSTNKPQTMMISRHAWRHALKPGQPTCGPLANLVSI